MQGVQEVTTDRAASVKDGSMSRKHRRRAGWPGAADLALLAIATFAGMLPAQGPPSTPRETASPDEGLLSGAREAPAEPANPFEDRIETDRDSFTPSTKNAGPGLFILESSFTFEDNPHSADT
jgi:hypothetical protein